MLWTRLIGACVALTLLCAPAAAQAPHRTGEHILVELYTSQGCNTCRRANRLLGQLAEEPDIIALTFPVDYWDYLGWRDTFAQSDFTLRQRRYWRSLRARSLYTPEIVVNGAAHTNGAREEGVRAMIASFRTAPVQPGPRIAIQRDRSRIQVQIGRGPPRDGLTDVWVIPYDPGPVWQTVRTGENAGHRVAHYNLARDIRRLGEWMGEPARFEYSYCRPECVIIVQERAGGRVLAVARTTPEPREQ
jgi:hypothetical protein